MPGDAGTVADRQTYTTDKRRRKQRLYCVFTLCGDENSADRRGGLFDLAGYRDDRAAGRGGRPSDPAYPAECPGDHASRHDNLDCEGHVANRAGLFLSRVGPVADQYGRGERLFGHVENRALLLVRTPIQVLQNTLNQLFVVAYRLCSSSGLYRPLATETPLSWQSC
jgi:hypothetical protein